MIIHFENSRHAENDMSDNSSKFHGIYFILI